MRLGIFGGSFDPVHNGHLALARACQEQAALDEVWFTPTAIQPLKHDGPHATDVQRVEMLHLAIESDPSEPGRPRPRSSWRVCTLEIDRGGYSYTVDTLRQIHVELPGAELFFMIGADAMRDIPRWKEPDEIFRLATPLLVRRAGEPEPNIAIIASLCSATYQPRLVEMRAIDASSSEIRRRVAAGEPIDDFVPAPVAEYIALHALYR
ncbi:MAG: nicotinate-nucleotide adenylyltransferase [Planctomycetes bacterium]|nr:nicotinate-nucleotide adenylyltransferase [Planctomycetota bacterium]